MFFSRTKANTIKHHRAWLYSAVFNGKISLLLVLLLFVSFIIQPVHKAFAFEEVPEAVPPDEPAIADDVRLDEPVLEESPPPEESPPAVEETEIPESSGEIPDAVAVSDGEAELELTEPNTDTEVTVDESDPLAEDEEVVSDLAAEGSDETSTTTEVAVSDESESESVPTSNESSQLDEQQQATSAEPLPDTIVKSQYVITDENYYQFSKQSCVAVGDGAYHCSADSVPEIDSNAVVYSEQGSGGTMEVFLRTTGGDVKQLTDNAYDDTSPHYDPESMRVVWQRLIDGRYQVVVYDIALDEEQQLTFSRTNNMEPKVSDAGIVWQAWDNNDWEIMYFDGTYTDQLTDNDSQDVAPVIEDGYVLWSVLGTEAQEARVYSLDTGEILTITGHEGGSIVNPRFVLVYDTKFDNGDIVTQGFDPVTGLSAPIASKPAPEPVNIPDADPIGEIRALIQNKSSQKDEKDSPLLKATSSGEPPLASTTPGTLDLTKSTTTTPTGDVTLETVDSEPEFELTDYDLVIVPAEVVESASSTQP